ncbi:MAG: ribonuclease H-like domain-containing protein, partial [Armatimonadetes bacterium]|nr:ribonuclease H-like domain-containing protein [Armatimonadota bacterium]
RIYTKGEDLQDFAEDISEYSLLVTFFGTCFDVPFLLRRFPQLAFDHLHIDLCWALRRLGLTGGLKHIERQLGVPRSPETENHDGWDAVRLWREWERGSRESLDRLKAYNREDIVNLERLMHYAYDHLRTKTGIP